MIVVIDYHWKFSGRACSHCPLTSLTQRGQCSRLTLVFLDSFLSLTLVVTDVEPLEGRMMECGYKGTCPLPSKYHLSVLCMEV